MLIAQLACALRIDHTAHQVAPSTVKRAADYNRLCCAAHTARGKAIV
jgi:hypothetical protein